MPTTQKNEGEGSRSAARAYNKATTAFAKSGKVAPAAKEAKRAVSSKNEAREMKKAEEIGKRPAKPPAAAKSQPRAAAKSSTTARKAR